MAFTYDDFLKALGDRNMSDADKALAKKNPNAGIGILNYQNDYNKVGATEEEKALAHQGAERIRSQYGQYTGGADGGGYYLNDISPGSFAMGEKKPSFSYDMESDPVYQAYQKQYTREGKRATENALGAAAAATGGIPSTYALTAAAQAGDYYASQLSDKVPELYQQAYNRYANDLNQYNTDRSFQYGQHLDEIANRKSLRDEENQKALLAAQFGDNSYLNGMGINTDNDPAERQWKAQLANLALQAGDPSLYEKLFGIHPDQTYMNPELLSYLLAQQAAGGNSSGMNQVVGHNLN